MKTNQIENIISSGTKGIIAFFLLTLLTFSPQAQSVRTELMANASSKPESPEKVSKSEVTNSPANAGSLLADSCAGVYSPGNPYPCCSYSGINGYGNCTFAAWYHAKRFWNVSLPTWGGGGLSDAKYWFDKLKDINGYPTSPTPALYSIAVSTTIHPSGHVAWVMEIIDNNVVVLEQSCGSGNWGITQTSYPISKFNKGFVLSPVPAPSPTLTLATTGPIGIGNHSLNFNQTNVNPGMRVVVIFPSGGRTTLKDAQLTLNGGTLTTHVTLGTAGTYKFQVFNENGKYSGMTNVVVS